MPHGAGYAGGHDGGSCHSGGHIYAYGGPYYQYEYGRRSLWCSVFWLTFFAVALSLGGIFSVRYAAPSDNSNSKDLAPNETRVVTYSYAFCKSITVSTASYIIEPGTLYILSRAPALDSEDSFTFNEQPLFASSNTHHHWNFYLYPGSILNVSACRSSAAFFDFNYYLIKGKDNFNSWVDNPRSSIAKQFFTISNLCSSGTKQQIPIYSVEEEGEYYMAFFHDTTYAEIETLDIDFDISRTKYTVDPDAVLSNCSVSDFDKQCTVDVPLSYSIGLVTRHASDTTDWSSSITFTTDCRAGTCSTTGVIWLSSFRAE